MSAFEEKFKLAAEECGFKPVSEDPKNKEFAVEYPINKRFALNVEKVRVEAKYRATRITYRIVWINGHQWPTDGGSVRPPRVGLAEPDRASPARLLVVYNQGDSNEP